MNTYKTLFSAFASETLSQCILDDAQDKLRDEEAPRSVLSAAKSSFTGFRTSLHGVYPQTRRTVQDDVTAIGCCETVFQGRGQVFR